MNSQLVVYIGFARIETDAFAVARHSLRRRCVLSSPMIGGQS